MNEKQCCGTCAHHKPLADEFGRDNKASEAYGLEAQWDDWCEEYSERED